MTRLFQVHEWTLQQVPFDCGRYDQQWSGPVSPVTGSTANFSSEEDPLSSQSRVGTSPTRTWFSLQSSESSPRLSSPMQADTPLSRRTTTRRFFRCSTPQLLVEFMHGCDH